jgi:hypothetical protein
LGLYFLWRKFVHFCVSCWRRHIEAERISISPKMPFYILGLMIFHVFLQNISFRHTADIAWQRMGGWL